MYMLPSDWWTFGQTEAVVFTTFIFGFKMTHHQLPLLVKADKDDCTAFEGDPTDSDPGYEVKI